MKFPCKHKNQETVAGFDATCTDTGLTDGIKCTDCDEMLTAQQTIPAKGHTEEAVPGYDATCTADSLTDGITCSVCGATVKAQEVISAPGYDWVDADCTTAKTCSDCGETEGDALGHSYDAVVTEPDCVNGGYTTYICSACGDSYVADYEDALGHTLTCADNGDGTHNVVCDICTTTVEWNVTCTYDAETHICDCGAVEKFTVMQRSDAGGHEAQRPVLR